MEKGKGSQSGHDECGESAVCPGSIVVLPFNMHAVCEALLGKVMFHVKWRSCSCDISIWQSYL